MKSFNYKSTFGFSLVEMMVSISIIVIITATVLYNHRRFNDSLALSTAAYEVALAIRQSQVSGLSVEAASSESTAFDYAYGTLFRLANTHEYHLFVDADDDDRCDDCGVEGGEGIGGWHEIGNGIYMEDICAIHNNGSENCSPLNVHITFKRPKPEAVLYFGNGDISNPDLNYYGARIKLRSPQGSTRTVEVYRTGQISAGS